MKEKDRTVTALLTATRTEKKKGKPHKNREMPSLPRHTYIYCRSRAIAERFLRDTEKEGFLFVDNRKHTEKEPDDIYALNNDFTISYTGFAAHAMFGGGGKHVVWIDYGNYISGEKDFRKVERQPLCSPSRWKCRLEETSSLQAMNH